MQKNIALVPLRGGSKGIIDKNIIDLCGKPLCKWSIEAAKGASKIEDVFVSTDSKKIKEIVLGFNLGIKVIDRPKELASDRASTDSVLVHFAKNIEFDNLITIQATSPLISSQAIEEGLNLYFKKKYDSLLSIKRTKQFLWGDDYKPLNYNPSKRPRRQDFNGAAIENGAFYITKKKVIENYGTRLAGNIGFYEMTEEDSHEIDSLIDFEIVKSIMNFRNFSDD